MLKNFTDADLVTLNEIIEKLVDLSSLPFSGLESEKSTIAVGVFEEVYKDRDRILDKGLTFKQYFCMALKRCSFNVLCERYGFTPNDYAYYTKVSEIKIKYQIPLHRGNAYKYSLLSGLTVAKIFKAIEVEERLQVEAYNDKFDYRSTLNPFDYGEKELKTTCEEWENNYDGENN